jgi:hypothetical protein
MTWNKYLPKATDSFSDMPQICQDNFDAIEDFIGVEHYTLSSALSGLHKPGLIGVVVSASSATIAAITSPGSGALAWDITKGYWQRYWLSWGVPGAAGTKWSRIRAMSSVDQALAANTATQIVFGNTLTEFASNTFTVSTGCSGYYLIVAACTLSGTLETATSNPQLSLSILKTDTVVSSATKVLSANGYAPDETIKIVDMVYLTAGETIKINVTQTKIANVILCGADATYVAIHRLGSQGM